MEIVRFRFCFDVSDENNRKTSNTSESIKKSYSVEGWFEVLEERTICEKDYSKTSATTAMPAEDGDKGAKREKKDWGSGKGKGPNKDKVKKGQRQTWKRSCCAFWNCCC